MASNRMLFLSSREYLNAATRPAPAVNLNWNQRAARFSEAARRPASSTNKGWTVTSNSPFSKDGKAAYEYDRLGPEAAYPLTGAQGSKPPFELDGCFASY